MSSAHVLDLCQAFFYRRLLGVSDVEIGRARIELRGAYFLRQGVFHGTIGIDFTAQLAQQILLRLEFLEGRMNILTGTISGEDVGDLAGKDIPFGQNRAHALLQRIFQLEIGAGGVDCVTPRNVPLEMYIETRSRWPTLMQMPTLFVVEKTALAGRADANTAPTSVVELLFPNARKRVSVFNE